MATMTGLEPATSGVTGRHSNRLNYRTLALFRLPFGWRGIGCFAFAMQSYAVFLVPPNFFEKKCAKKCILAVLGNILEEKHSDYAMSRRISRLLSEENDMRWRL